MARITVIGGGISGLSLVHYLKKFARIANKSLHEITLLESSETIGGCIQTKRHKDGVIHELGPRSIRLTAAYSARNTLALIDELGLGDKLDFVDPKNKAAKNRYVYCNGCLHKAPSGILSLLTQIPGTKTRLYEAVRHDIKTPRLDITKYAGEDLSVHEFIKYRFGEEMADNFIDPLMRGVTAGDCRKLSVRSNLAEFFEKEQEFGSIVRGLFKQSTKFPYKDKELDLDLNGSISMKRAFQKHVTAYNLKAGLQSLTETLCDSIMSYNDKNTVMQIYNQSPVERLTYHPNKEWDIIVRTINGDSVTLNADHVFAALPSKHLANILHLDTEIYKDSLKKFQAKLLETPFAPVACVCLEYRGIMSQLPKEVQAFGFLTQSKSGSKVLGISFDSIALPGHDNGQDVFRMTAMIGGYWFEDVTGTDDVDSVPEKQYTSIALDEVKKILNITAEPQRVTVKVWKDGIAQYKVGHKTRVESMRKDIEQLSIPITLLGQSYDGISINDVIYSSRIQAYKFIENLPMI